MIKVRVLYLTVTYSMSMSAWKLLTTSGFEAPGISSEYIEVGRIFGSSFISVVSRYSMTFWALRVVYSILIAAYLSKLTLQIIK